MGTMCSSKLDHSDWDEKTGNIRRVSKEGGGGEGEGGTDKILKRCSTRVLEACSDSDKI